MNTPRKGGHTAEYLKRQAKKLKKATGVSHVTALDIESQKLGFTNYKNFLNVNTANVPAADHVLRPRTPRPSVLGYHVIFFNGKRHRPNMRMAIPEHQSVASLLKGVLADCYTRKSVTKPIGSVRCDLDDWVQREYNREELPHEIFSDLYYPDFSASFEKTISADKVDRHIQSIGAAKDILLRCYHDCAPIRDMVKRLDLGIMALKRWGETSAAKKDKEVTKRTSKAFKGKLSRGTLVRVRPLRIDGIVLDHQLHDGTVKCYTHRGEASLLRHEAWYIQDQSPAATFKPMRLYLPYGKWTCADGSEVLFNRDYSPIWLRKAGGGVSSIDPDTWINYVHSEHYNDDGMPWKNQTNIDRCLSVLRQWGVENRKPEILNIFDLVVSGESPKILTRKNPVKVYPPKN